MNETQQRILAAVDQVIADHGPSGVTLRRVGEAAGLSHTAPAHYYKNKPGLFTAYIAQAWDHVADRMESAAEGVDSREALVAAAVSFAQFALDRPSAFAVLSRLELANVEDPSLWQARERGFFLLYAMVEKAQLDGWATDRKTLDMLATMWSFVHGFVDLWVGGPLWAPYDGHEMIAVLRRLLEDFLDRC